MAKNRFSSFNMLPLHTYKSNNKYTPNEAFELMNLQTAIEILQDLAVLTDDLQEWFNQYKYVERYAARPELPRFKGTFVELLTKLTYLKEDRASIEYHFKKAIKEYEQSNKLITKVS